VWNAFSSLSGKPVFGRLESLTLERSGLTNYQLECIINGNPRIKEIRLQKCLTLDDEFFEYLAHSPIANTLEVLHFTKSDRPEIDDRILKYIDKLTALKVSFLRSL